MITIKTGKNIKTIKDVENMVVALILKAKRYNKHHIEQWATQFLRDSDVKISNKELANIVDRYLKLLQNYDLIVCKDGVYNTTQLGKDTLLKANKEKNDDFIL